jgi:hypothetical protein
MISDSAESPAVFFFPSERFLLSFSCLQLFTEYHGDLATAAPFQKRQTFRVLAVGKGADPLSTHD